MLSFSLSRSLSRNVDWKCYWIWNTIESKTSRTKRRNKTEPAKHLASLFHTDKESVMFLRYISIRDKLQNGTKAILVNRLVFYVEIARVILADFFDYSPSNQLTQTQNERAGESESVFIPKIKIDDKCKRIEIQWWENISFICLLLGCLLLFFPFSMKTRGRRRKNRTQEYIYFIISVGCFRRKRNRRLWLMVEILCVIFCRQFFKLWRILSTRWYFSSFFLSFILTLCDCKQWHSKCYGCSMWLSKWLHTKWIDMKIRKTVSH